MRVKVQILRDNGNVVTESIFHPRSFFVHDFPYPIIAEDRSYEVLGWTFSADVHNRPMTDDNEDRIA